MPSKEELRESFFEKFDPEFIALGYKITDILTYLECRADLAEEMSIAEGIDPSTAYTIISLNLLKELRELDPEPPIPISKRQQEINAQLMGLFFPHRS